MTREAASSLVKRVAAPETPRYGGELVSIVPAEPPSLDAHNARVKGRTITPSHFLNNRLDTGWLAAK